MSDSTSKLNLSSHLMKKIEYFDPLTVFSPVSTIIILKVFEHFTVLMSTTVFTDISTHLLKSNQVLCANLSLSLFLTSWFSKLFRKSFPSRNMSMSVESNLHFPSHRFPFVFCFVKQNQDLSFTFPLSGCWRWHTSNTISILAHLLSGMSFSVKTGWAFRAWNLK